MKKLPPLVLVALAALAVLAVVTPRAARAERHPDVQLIEPQTGAELRGGSIAVLSWAADPRFLGAVGREEWEAFLSLDGGRTFAFRITPHLDIGLRRVAFEVPDFASDDARLLLRFGDERRETEIELPRRWRIRRGSSAAFWSGHDASLRPAGEAARAGGPGVVAWVEGDRGGRAWRTREAAPTPFDWSPFDRPRVRAGDHCEACDQSSAHPLGPPSDCRMLFDTVRERAARRSASRAAGPPHDILRLSQRQNE